ncbi:damage-inducible protein DinB [Pseudoalteromonas sp. JBTF-M23]|uniref:Damage-inducible protein DinB n=1 Tax=Pseudoalteromonas caenipelagi TaxID=2726988 RepID=A0A849V835_9GAMM|nr:DinB family protein [Pseudoalteromonas caenipelagi]NOU49719.1 damage-inducible protein DinB [Pseudoalteromonas caenipelagi]
MLFIKAFEYKKWANNELLNFGERQLSLLPKEDADFFIRILNHTTVVDSLFISRILGKPEKYRADNTLETPQIFELRKTMAKNDTWLIHFNKTLSMDGLQRDISFQFTDGDHGRMSVHEILLHLLTHGSNHRGMASRVLASNNLDRPRDTYTRYIHTMDPARLVAQEMLQIAT